MSSRLVLTLLLIASPAVGAPKTYTLGVQQPSVSSGARAVAYVLAGRLWVADLASGTGRMLPTTGDRVGSPVLSPDGQTVVYLEWEGRHHWATLKRRSLPEGAPVEVFRTRDDLRDDFDVDFAAGRVVFGVAGQGLFELPLAGGTPAPLTRQGSDRSPRYAPDGASIAFVRSSADSVDILVWARADGATRRVQATVNAGERIDRSPDGSAFVFESHDTGTMDLWTVPSRGGAARRLTRDAAQERFPSWAADGAIYFQKERRLWRLPASTLTPGTGANASAAVPVALTSAIEPLAPERLLIRGAHVLDVRSGTWRRDQDILIAGGTIAALGPRGSLDARGARELDATGLWAIPGLVDAHTHYQPWMGPLMRAFGVSLMRDMGSDTGVDWILDERDFTRDGFVDGPAIAASGPVVNGSGTGRPGQILTENLDVLRETVDWLASQGADVIKIGSENDVTTLRAILETAHARGLAVWGHIGLATAQQAIELGQDGIEHLRGLAWSTLPARDRPEPVPRRLTGMRREATAWWDRPPQELAGIAREMVRRKVGLDPTITVMRTFAHAGEDLPAAVRSLIPPHVLAAWERSMREGPLADEDRAAFAGAERHQAAFIKAYYDAGGKLLTGSDVGPEWVVPGWSIHQEMSRLVDLGVSPIDAIRAATIHGAEACRAAERSGSLEVGRLGDLLLLERDPLQDITATRAMRWVVSRGRAIQGTGVRTGTR